MEFFRAETENGKSQMQITVSYITFLQNVRFLGLNGLFFGGEIDLYLYRIIIQGPDDSVWQTSQDKIICL